VAGSNSRHLQSIWCITYNLQCGVSPCTSSPQSPRILRLVVSVMRIILLYNLLFHRTTSSAFFAIAASRIATLAEVCMPQHRTTAVHVAVSDGTLASMVGELSTSSAGSSSMCLQVTWCITCSVMWGLDLHLATAITKHPQLIVTLNCVASGASSDHGGMWNLSLMCIQVLTVTLKRATSML
jgi:hypothetical protein